MKQISILLVIFFVSIGVSAQNPQEGITDMPIIIPDMPSFGEQIDNNNVINSQEMSEKYAALAVADTMQIKFTATVTDVCKVKGCWMSLELEDGQEAMVRFKDYGFFMPKDIAGKEVIVNGLAFVEEMSIEDQKHYAKDGGKSESEIAQITTVKKTYSFEADGVLLKE